MTCFRPPFTYSGICLISSGRKGKAIYDGFARSCPVTAFKNSFFVVFTRIIDKTPGSVKFLIANFVFQANTDFFKAPDIFGIRILAVHEIHCFLLVPVCLDAFFYAASVFQFNICFESSKSDCIGIYRFYCIPSNFCLFFASVPCLQCNFSVFKCIQFFFLPDHLVFIRLIFFFQFKAGIPGQILNTPRSAVWDCHLILITKINRKQNISGV